MTFGLTLCFLLAALFSSACAVECPYTNACCNGYYDSSYCYNSIWISYRSNCWQYWSSWTACDRTCGGGNQQRTRMCLSNSYTERETQPCGQICMNQGQYINGQCKCVTGHKGLCCEVAPHCQQPCANGGKCVADNICSCLPGFYGSHCERGGGLDNLLLPKLNPTLPVDDVHQKLSWYDSLDSASDDAACFVKLLTKNAAYDTIIIADSMLNGTSDLFGNYTMGPIDSVASTNDSTRFVCLQVRCPGTLTTGEDFDVLVKVTLESRYKQCHIRQTAGSLVSIFVNTETSGSDSLSFVLENGLNYGPKYGIYISTGYRDKAISLARQTCQSGHYFDFDHLNPSIGTLTEYTCA